MAASETSKPTTKMASKPAGLKVGIVQVTPFQQNCALIWDEVSMAGAVVDPGGDLDRIMAAIDQVGMIPEKILLTHGHIDHAAGADELRSRLKVKIEGPHKADKVLLDHLEEQGKSYQMPARNVTPDHWLEEGDTVLLCSDGLSNLIHNEEIRDALLMNPLDDVPQVLIRLANERGGDDNITVVTVQRVD